MLENNQTKPIKLSVVGHTNTGKTSLLRTLLRDENFGEVADQVATTRHVEEAMIDNGQEPLIALYDTPGLEDAGGLLHWLNENTPSNQDGIERLKIFLEHDLAKTQFEQEAKVIRQMLASQAGLYVVDAREPVLEKYRDELTILSWSARPVMPVFNFIQEGKSEAWQEMLSRRNLHVFCGFDTVAFDFDSEMTLWQKLTTMLPEHQQIKTLIQYRQQQWQDLYHESLREIAFFLIQVSAYQVDIASDEEPSEYLTQMQKNIQQAEQELYQNMLHRYRFYRNEIATEQVPIKLFSQSVFDKEVWAEYGIRTGSSAMAGAIVGLGVDSVVGGASLGAGALIGGVIGSLIPHIKNIHDSITGHQTLHIDPVAISILASRALALQTVLMTRGHATQSQPILNSDNLPWKADRLPDILRKARVHENWSSFNGYSVDSAKEKCRIEYYQLAQELEEKITKKAS